MMRKALFSGGNKTVNKETTTSKLGEDSDQIKWRARVKLHFLYWPTSCTWPASQGKRLINQTPNSTAESLTVGA